MELALDPTGRIVILDVPDSSESGPSSGVDGVSDRWLKRVRAAFDASQEAGLFLLATERDSAPVVSSLSFWRDYASRYLGQLCHMPDDARALEEPIEPPPLAELADLVLAAPPMPGGEYLTVDLLADGWRRLDAWARAEVAGGEDGLGGFLARRAPLWHQVGRVCFHLAENRRDVEYPFAFLATYTSGVATSARVRHEPLSAALRQYAGTRNKRALIKLLSPVDLASQRSELVREMVESGDLYQPLAWSPRQAHRFLQEVPAMEDSGIVVRVPDWWKKRPRPRVGISIGTRKKGKFSAASMLDFQVQRALGDQQLSEAEWQQLMKADDGLVLLRGQWVEVDRHKLAEAMAHWQSAQDAAADGLSFVEAMRLLAGAPRDLADDDAAGDPDPGWSFVDAGQWLGGVLADLRRPENLEHARLNDDFKAQLREYQATGVSWLMFLGKLGLGACLADDMGLGKTIQVLAVLTILARQRPARTSLLVLPASLVANWKAEIERFAPRLRACYLHPSEISKEEMQRLAQSGDRAFQETDVVLTTYGMLLRQPWLLKLDWRLVVLDEAQAIKNTAARQTRTVKKLKSEARIALTGTPIENRLSDLWSLFDFLCPGLLGSQRTFKDFVKRLEARTEQQYAPLRALIQPYILRRLKTDRQVIPDLPDKVEVQAFCGLTKNQAALYSRLVKEMAETLENADGIARRGLVLAYLMRFKQVCNHPSQLLGDGGFEFDQSGKYARLAEICEEIAARQEKVLVFTQFREMTEPLAEYLAHLFGRPGLVLHGGTAVRRRKTLVDQFQRPGGPPFFVLSLKAAGVGLNLTAATHVVHFDRWWNPAVENQATDRAFRIGQQRNVLVHKFVCRGTIEERIDAMISEKKELAEDLLQGGPERILTEMDDRELMRLVALDVSKAKA